MKKSRNEKKQIYFNDPQLECMYTAAHTSVIVGGRRLGKSHGFVAPFLIRNVQGMPRSAGGIVGATYKMLLTQTLPGTMQALEHFGYKRDKHYFIGRKPAKSAGFKTPHIEPAGYEHVLSWYNGSIQYLISQDRPGTSNSLTLDYLLLDEAKFLDFDQLKTETFPANGGYRGYFKHNPWHHGIMIVSDMPTTKKGSWFLNYQEKSNLELIETIQGLVVEKYRVKNKSKSLGWTPYLKNYYREIQRDLAKLRSIAVYYREWSSIQNLLVLGEKYIRQMKRDLPPLVFMTSIMSKRVSKLRDGFYPGLKESVHYYDAYDNNYLDKLDYDFNKLKKETCLVDGDLDKNAPICVAFDYNANINWLVAGQQDGIKMKVLKSFYVKYERKLKELVKDFCDYYKLHRTRDVVYYFDNTALGSNYAVNDDDFASTICTEFEKNGWKVTRQHIGNPLKHHEKHMMVDKALKGDSEYLFPLFNKPNNEALLLGMEQTRVKIGPYGFQKDKSGEKLAENEEDLLEYRTDGTDAFDTLFVGMNKFPVFQTVNTSTGSVFM